MAERRLSFNVDALKKAAAKSVQKPESDVRDVQKLAEGGFNRIFEISMQDGMSVLARLPYPSTFPRHLAVASEVATMDFVRAHGISTPRVLGYAIEENPVGSDYILMEKLPGRPIGDAWFDMSEQQRLQFLYEIVKLESALFDIQLPASGSIYYCHDLDSTIPTVLIPGTDGQFCVGPYTGSRWWAGERANLELDRGPREFHINYFVYDAYYVQTPMLFAFSKPLLRRNYLGYTVVGNLVIHFIGNIERPSNMKNKVQMFMQNL